MSLQRKTPRSALRKGGRAAAGAGGGGRRKISFAAVPEEDEGDEDAGDDEEEEEEDPIEDPDLTAPTSSAEVHNPVSCSERVAQPCSTLFGIRLHSAHRQSYKHAVVTLPISIREPLCSLPHVVCYLSRRKLRQRADPNPVAGGQAEAPMPPSQPHLDAPAADRHRCLAAHTHNALPCCCAGPYACYRCCEASHDLMYQMNGWVVSASGVSVQPECGPVARDPQIDTHQSQPVLPDDVKREDVSTPASAG